MKQKLFRRLGALLLTFALSLALVVPAWAASSVTLGSHELTLQKGESTSIAATVTIDGNWDMNTKLYWQSSDPTVVEVNRNENVIGGDGIIKAVDYGTAAVSYIYEQDGRVVASDTCMITVPNPASDVIINSNYNTTNNPLVLNRVGNSSRLTATVTPENATDTVTWSSSDPSVVSVASDSSDPLRCLVTAQAVGEATVTVTAGEKSASCRVEVSGVTVSPTSLSLEIGGSATITSRAYGSAAKDPVQRVWQSSDPSVAAVDRSTGRVTARGVGTADISLTYSSAGTIYAVPRCRVTVTENDSTTLTGTATAGAPYVFSDILSALNGKCPGTLSYITNLSVPTGEGVLYYNHTSTDDTGFGVGATERYYYEDGVLGERYLGGLTFVPNSDFNGETSITFTGYTTAGKSYSGKIRLSVTGSGNVTFITKAGEPVKFQSSNFSAACRSETGREVESVSFELPDPSRGAFYYGYTGAGQYRYEVSPGEEYYAGRAFYLDQVSFVPAENYIGTLRLPFYGTDTMGETFTGYLNLIVVPSYSRGQRSELTITALRDTAVGFDKFDFTAVCQQILNEPLNYVRFTPPERSAGTLYYNYRSRSNYDSLVNANTRYYASRSPRISDLTFVPASGRTDPVTIEFTGIGSYSGKAYHEAVTIYFRDGGGGGAITYAATSGQAIPLETADFDGLCQELTGNGLSRIVFQSLPDTYEGTLYTNYNSGYSSGNRVTFNTTIYRSSLSTVAFVPKSDFTGTVELEFIGYDTNGEHFNGTLLFEVEEGNSTLSYYAYSGATLSFRPSDFNDLCKRSTGGTLNYVRFQLPASSAGTLYYRYNSTSTGRNSVSSGTSFYYSPSSSYSYNRLENVFFVSAPNYSGTVSFEFNGISTSGARFTGTVEIAVSPLHSADLDYTVTSLPFSFSAEDFYVACAPALERALSYVTFNALPDASKQGRLYLNYTRYGTGTAAATTVRYNYEGSTSLDQLVFVPKADYKGTVELPYTAYDTRGNSVSGTVRLTVTAPKTCRFRDVEQTSSWAAPSVEFLYQGGVVKGTGGGSFSPSLNVTRGDFVLMLYRAFRLPAAGTASYSDVPSDSYYAKAIASAKAAGLIPAGTDLFYPDVPIIREDAFVMLYKALRRAGVPLPSGTAADLSSFRDHDSVSADAVNMIASLVRLKVLKGDNTHRLNAEKPITRAEVSAILHRAMTL